MSEIPKKSKPISVRRYRIADYAHYMGVGRDFLKHYEKCGLLSADHHDNGYRHFGFEQSSLILECMRLRNCGYTVREMGGMLRDLSGVEVRQSLHEAREALEKRIKHTQAIAAEIERLEEWFDIRQSQPEDWEVTSAEGRYYLPHANGSQFLEDERIYEILPQWLDWLSVESLRLSSMRPIRLATVFHINGGFPLRRQKQSAAAYRSTVLFNSYRPRRCSSITLAVLAGSRFSNALPTALIRSLKCFNRSISVSRATASWISL